MKRVQEYLAVVLLVSSVLATFSAQAVFVEERLENAAQEERAREIAEGIRCLVCQNQSIMDSNAGLAKDLRGIVRERVKAGDNDDQVRHYLVERYGDWVLLNPPFKMRTLLLWLGPLLVFFGGAIVMFLFLRRKSRMPASTEKSAPLSEAEQAELAQLLNVTDDDEEHR